MPEAPGMFYDNNLKLLHFFILIIELEHWLSFKMLQHLRYICKIVFSIVMLVVQMFDMDRFF